MNVRMMMIVGVIATIILAALEGSQLEKFQEDVPRFARQLATLGESGSTEGAYFMSRPCIFYPLSMKNSSEHHWSSTKLSSHRLLPAPGRLSHGMGHYCWSLGPARNRGVSAGNKKKKKKQYSASPLGT